MEEVADRESECRGAEADENHASSLLPPGANPGERLVSTDPEEHDSTQDHGEDEGGRTGEKYKRKKRDEVADQMWPG
jgi:hypothetical protein